MWETSNTVGRIFKRNFQKTELENFNEFIEGSLGKPTGMIDRILRDTFTYSLKSQSGLTGVSLYEPRKENPIAGRIILTGNPVVKDIAVEPIAA